MLSVRYKLDPASPDHCVRMRLLVVVAALLVVGVAAAAPTADNRPNIIFILADDLGEVTVSR